MMDFYLEQKRKEKHLSRRELAEKSGVHEQTIKFLEKGYNDPLDAKLSTLVKLASALHCKIRDFYPNEKSL